MPGEMPGGVPEKFSFRNIFGKKKGEESELPPPIPEEAINAELLKGTGVNKWFKKEKKEEGPN